MKQYKLVIVGDGGVGKTSYVKRLLDNTFVSNYIPTLGVDVVPYIINVNDTPVKFNIWDTAGQEKFIGLKDGYLIGADCAIVMVRDRLASFETHIETVRRMCGDIPVIIVINKKRKFTYLPDDIPDNVIMCSAKHNLYIKDPLYKLVDML